MSDKIERADAIAALDVLRHRDEDCHGECVTTRSIFTLQAIEAIQSLPSAQVEAGVASIDDAFYALTVKQRDDAWREIEALKAAQPATIPLRGEAAIINEIFTALAALSSPFLSNEQRMDCATIAARAILERGVAFDVEKAARHATEVFRYLADAARESKDKIACGPDGALAILTAGSR